MSESTVKTQLALVTKKLRERTLERDSARSRIVENDRQMEDLEQQLKTTRLKIAGSDNELFLQDAQLKTKELELAAKDADLAAASIELTQLTSDLARSNRYLAKRTAELERANEELKFLMQQKEDFVAALTHDLKSPLIACMRAAELLVLDKVPDANRKVVYKQLLESTRCMLRMIWNLLDVYRHESGQLSPLAECVDVRELLTQCLSEFSFCTEEKQLQLELRLGDDFTPLQTDRILLRRVLINLLDNAVKFTPVNGKLQVTAFQDVHQCCVTVSDSGPGLSEEQKDRIFERFWQTQLGRDRGLGTGLGLHLSRQIMSALGGTIECFSKEGSGTQFTIKLPRR
ncbi:MAG TPA: HAMP domain-containing sensor histidine kinase [Drouetiella sp.]|jgi:signal transduction histidine kinase